MHVSKVIVHDAPKERPRRLFCDRCNHEVNVEWKMYADLCSDCYIVLVQY